MAGVQVPIQTKYDGKGFEQLRKDAEKAQRELLRNTRQQISEHRRLTSLTSKLNRDLAAEAKAQEREAARIANQQRQALQVGAAVAAGAAALLVEFGRESINAARESAAAEAQLNAALQSTGHAAGMTAGELKALAGQLQSTTNFEDDATIKAEAMLLTFTNIGNTTFPRATKAILDVSTAMGQDLQTSAIQVGKALNDPVEGLSALRRVGIQFTDQQEQQIKTLVEAGKVTEAQAVILAELERQFGGSAAAAREADGNIIALSNAYGDFQEAVGRAIQPSSELNQILATQLEGMSKTIDSLILLSKAYNAIHSSGNTAMDALLSLDTAARIAVNPIGTLAELYTEAGHNSEEWIDAIIKTNEQIDNGSKAIPENTGATEDNTAAIEENAKALEDLAKRQERVNQIRRDAAREIIDIDERAAADAAKVWDDYWSDQENEWQDHNARLTDLKRKAANEQRKAEADLSKELSKLDKDTAKQIADVQKKAAAEKTNEQRRRQVDALGDERLFNFELQQMAAEGQGNAIREAIERRAIEEQIAKEKAAVEGQIEQQQQQDEVQRIRDTAAERRASLQEDYAEETALRDERLAADLAAEQENYAERMIDLRTYREEKLAEIETSKAEALEALGRELAEAQELTSKELAALTPVAAKLGEDAGKAFAEGLSRGIETNRQVEQLLAGQDAAPQRSLASSLPPGAGSIPRFQFGGTVGGPIGAPTLAVVHGGETVMPAGQGGNNINVTINAAGGINQARIEAALQEFVNDILVPMLS